MFKYKKRLLTSLLITLGVSSSFIEAAAPAQPTELGSTKITCSPSVVRLSFLDNNSSNENNFTATISEYDNPSNSWTVTVPGQSTKPYAYINVSTGIDDLDKIYMATVVASNANGDSLPSDPNYFRMTSTFGCTLINAPGPYIGVSPIKDPDTQEINKTSVRVNFLDNSDNENGFLLFDDTGDINVTLPKNNASEPSETYGILTGLTCDKVYTIKAIAFKGNVNSLPSNSRSFNIHTTFGVDCNDSGLKGNYYGVNEQLESISQFRTIIASTKASAKFIATKLDYGYGTGTVSLGTNLQFFLKDDASSLNVDPADTSDGGIYLKGQIYLDEGDYNFRVRSDDGYQILIDDQSVAEIDYNQSPTTTTHSSFTIDESGYHDIDIIWWDQGGEYQFKVEISQDGGVSYKILDSEMLLQ